MRADQKVEGVTRGLIDEILATGATLSFFPLGVATSPAEWDRIFKDSQAPVPRAQGSRDLATSIELELRRQAGDGGRSVRPCRSVERIGARWETDGPRMVEAVHQGLAWLVAHQSADGHWGARGHADVCLGKAQMSDGEDGRGNAAHDVGVTGLALLALLTSGVTGPGAFPYGSALERGTRWLRKRQDSEGCLSDRSDLRWMYDHIAATHAMVEAYATTGGTADQECARAAVKFLEKARNPYFGWRYGVRPGDNDTSVTAWAMCAMAAARDVDRADVLTGRPPTFGLDGEAADGASAWIQKMVAPDLGQVGYVARGLGQGQKMGRDFGRYPPLAIDGCTMMGAATLFMAETTSDATGLRLALKRIRSGLPTFADGSTVDYNAWAFGTLAAWQAGDELWSDWRPRMAEALLAAQRRDGDVCGVKGSFQAIDPWSGEGGRVYSTAMGVLTALAPFRYLRAR